MFIQLNKHLFVHIGIYVTIYGVEVYIFWYNCDLHRSLEGVQYLGAG